MAPTSSHTDVDLVRDATDLVALISEHVALSVKGREHVGLCPFHDDHKPSFAVVTHKGDGFYKCFACGASGDCFRFVMSYHKMDFPEALRYLAERAGLELSRRSGAASADGTVTRSDLYRATAFALDYFRHTLADPQIGAEARRVTRERGITDEMVERFLIGAAPDSYSAFLSKLGGNRSSVEKAVAAGLLKKRADGQGTYDAFRHRLIFPIWDEVGRPVAFGGRVINPDDNPKYLNSAESPIFHKSRTLYGLHLAKRAIVETGQAIVTEGYTDVIACHQAGIGNVVGTLGTALTRDHAAILSKLCPTVILVFDGDEAGQKAADRAIEVFFTSSVDIQICVLPDDLDPDEMLKQADGPARLRTAIASAIEAIQFKLQRFQSGLSDAHGISARAQKLDEFLAELARLGFDAMPGVRKSLVLHRIAELLKLAVPDVKKALSDHARRAAPRSHASPTRATGAESAAPSANAQLPLEASPEVLGTLTVSRARRLAERELLATLLFEPTAGAGPDGSDLITSMFTPDEFLDAPARRIAELIFPWLQGGEPFNMQRVLAQIDDETTRATASNLFFEGQRRCRDDEDAAADELRSAAAGLRSCIERGRYEHEARAVASTSDETATGDVIDRIRNRQQHAYLPAAISQGLRS